MYNNLPFLSKTRVLSTKLSIKVFCLFIVILMAKPSLADYWVSGIIKDNQGAPVINMLVQVMDRNSITGDDKVGDATTNIDGRYLAHVSSPKLGHNDIYIKIIYKTALQGPLSNGKNAILCYDQNNDPGEFSTYGDPNGYYEDADNYTNIEINILPAKIKPYPPFSAISSIPYYVNYITGFNSGLRYLELQGILPSEWQVSQDFVLRVYVNTIDLSFGWHSDSDIQIKEYYLLASTSILDNDNNARAFFHEFGHVIAYRANGGFATPQSAYIKSHNYNSETSETEAIDEGWAEFVSSCITAGFCEKVINFDLDSPIWWRGGWGTSSPTGTDNSGEIVEGAIYRAWDTVNNFKEIFMVKMQDNPLTPKSFAEKYKIRYSPVRYRNLLDAYAGNGIVYTRAKMDGFIEGIPSNDATMKSVGNNKLINDTTTLPITEPIEFIRGTVTIKKSQVGKTMLNLVSSTNTLYGIALLYKPVNDEVWENSVFVGVSGWTRLPSSVIANDCKWDTTTEVDGDYDLALQAIDSDAWLDKLYPDFNQDPVPTTSTKIHGVGCNEKWLKYQGTWYSRTTNPGTDIVDPPKPGGVTSPPRPGGEDVKRGKIIIDNTPPIISNCKPTA